MRVVVVNDWFAEKMGYSENLLPKALAKLGVETHVVTSDLQPWYPNYKEAYGDFLGPRIQPVGTKSLNGFTLHRLPHGREGHGVSFRGFHRKLRELRPDVVQAMTIASWSTYQLARSRLLLGFRLFLEEHVHASVYSPPTGPRARTKVAFFRGLGRFVSLVSERCYPIAPDVARIAEVYFGYSPRKMQLCSLGVDTDAFTPARTSQQIEARRSLRAHLGFQENDLVAVYSGRFTPDKNPLCLAQAVDRLQTRTPHCKALLVGQGRAEDMDQIRRCRGVITHPFVQWPDLPDLYRAADIGVWPRQESTSQLDAAACGLPLVLSDRIEVRERVDGNGLLYRQDDPDDLAAKIQSLNDAVLRAKMGEAGAKKVQDRFSWDRIAKDRLRDYTSALNGRLQAA